MSCVHLRDYKSKFGSQPYQTIYGFFIAKPNVKSSKLLYHQVWVTCFCCGNGTNRILACLQCIFLGCYGEHAHGHSVKKSHLLFVEMSNGHIFCYGCNDYVYDSEFEDIAAKHNLAQRRNGDPVAYVKWLPTTSEDKLLKEHPKRIKMLNNSAAGMRRMVNLGNTCFMNCIMQALLHTPMLRDYFFTDKHKCYAQRKSDCLVCHFSRLFQKYYTDDPSILSLHEIVYLVWRNAHHLSGYEQQDAHEFLIAVLNLLHQYSTPNNVYIANSRAEASELSIYSSSEQLKQLSKDINSSGQKSKPNLLWNAPIFQNTVQYYGMQFSRNVSTTIDPIWDISLDIPDPPTAVNLFECLHHYTRAEPLGSFAKIKCNVCESYQESTKQLTFRTLPIVIVMHLKRFEHDNSRHKKKTMFVPFPIELDMSPFMSGCRNHCTEDKNIPCQASSNYDNRYTLYAVIVHNGTLNTGHYLAYIRQTKQTWFKCDDVRVNPAELDEVMASEGYLLFYHKTVLTYD